MIGFRGLDGVAVEVARFVAAESVSRQARCRLPVALAALECVWNDQTATAAGLADVVDRAIELVRSGNGDVGAVVRNGVDYGDAH